MKFLLLKTTLTLLGLTAFGANAGVINTFGPTNATNAATCSNTATTLTGVYISDFDISDDDSADGQFGENLLKNGPYTASDCIGLYKGNNEGKGKPKNNIGELGDGFLNGGKFKHKGKNYSFDELPFITESDLQDLDNDGTATDPGWIHLANFSTNGSGSYSHIQPNKASGTNIADLLRIDLDCANNKSCIWSLKTDIDIIDNVQDILGEATFDQLAIVIKASNRFAVYDFNFKDIFATEYVNDNGFFDPLFPDNAFGTPFTLTGTLASSDFLNKKDKVQGISHVTFLARDPAAVSIPEPSTILIFSVSVFGLAIRKLKK